MLFFIVKIWLYSFTSASWGTQQTKTEFHPNAILLFLLLDFFLEGEAGPPHHVAEP